MDHEIFKKSIKKAKDPKETDQTEEDDEDQFEINTLSTIDFKLSYDDFKLGKCK